MSDTFDPDAWPHTPTTAGAHPDTTNHSPRPAEDDDDDYDPLNIAEPSVPAYGAEPAGHYDDDDSDDYSTTGGTETYDYDYDAPATTPAHSVAPAGGYDDEDDDGGNGAYDSYDDQYDDDDDDNGHYNNYDDDDQNDGSGGGTLRKVVIALVVVAALLIIVVGGMSLLGGKKSNTSNVAAGKTSTTAKTGTTAKGGTTSTTFAGSSTPIPDDVTTALNQALSAWGQFAVDGNLDDVKPYFVNSGPQFVHFQAEAPTIAANPPGGETLDMAMENPKSVSPDANTWIIHGTVAVTRTGEKEQDFPWEIRMTRASAQQPWQVLTVRQY